MIDKLKSAVLWSGVSKVFVIAKDIQLAYLFGSSAIVDILMMSQSMIALPIMIINGILTATFVNNYIRIKRVSEVRAEEFYINVIYKIFFLCLIISLLMFIVRRPLIDLFAPGFNAEKKSALNLMFSASIIGMAFTIIQNTIVLRLQATDEHKHTNLLSAPQTIGVMCVIYLAYRVDEAILAMVNLIAPVIGVLYIYYVYKKRRTSIVNFNVLKSLRFSHHERQMLWFALPLIFSAIFNQVNMIVDRMIASNFPDGQLASLGYALKICAILSTFVLPVLAILNPHFAQMHKSSQENVYKSVSGIVKNTIMVLLPVLAIISIASEDIVKLIFGYGEFGQEAIKLTAGITSIYIYPAVLFTLASGIIVRFLFTVKRVAVTVYISLFVVFLNILLSVNLAREYGVYGLAFATLTSCGVGFVVYYYFFLQSVDRLCEMLTDISELLFVAFLALFSAYCTRLIKFEAAIEIPSLRLMFVVFAYTLIFVSAVIVTHYTFWPNRVVLAISRILR
jgi:putative peptidoglycan lipid II flippase